MRTSLSTILLSLAWFIVGLALILLYLFSIHPAIRQSTKLISPEEKTSSFSLENAPSESIRGMVTVFSGDVGWQSRTATMPSELKDKRVIQQGESLMTKENGTVTVTFPANVVLKMSPNTSLDIIQTLPGHTVFSQNSGTISYQNDSPTSVSIRTPSLLTTLTGGTGKVTIDANDPYTTISVLTGNGVSAFEDTEQNTTQVSILSGTSFVFNTASLIGNVE